MSKVSLRMQWGETHVRHGNAKNRMHINCIIALNLFLSFAISSGKKTSERKQAIELKYFGIVFSIPYEQIALVCLRCDYHCNNSFRCLVKISRKKCILKYFCLYREVPKAAQCQNINGRWMARQQNQPHVAIRLEQKRTLFMENTVLANYKC